jgi:hypothetical protein
MGDAAAQQQQKRAFFASFPPTGDKSMNVVSDVHHGSVRTVPLGKIENVVRTDTVPLAVLMNRVGCQVSWSRSSLRCPGKRSFRVTSKSVLILPNRKDQNPVVLCRDSSSPWSMQRAKRTASTSSSTACSARSLNR